MIDRQHALPLAKQAKALGISRGTLYYAARPVPAADLDLSRFCAAPLITYCAAKGMNHGHRQDG